MVHTTDDLDSVMGQVTSEFFERLSRGENPQVEEYTEKYPEIADLIRDMFPSLKLIQDAGSIEVTSSAALVSGGIDTNRPKQLGDYRILHEIGRGGMGVVYEAEQLSLSRIVALKVLPFAAILDEKAITRFKNEAKAAATLDHPNIVPIHAVGNERGVYYYAMSLISGLTLAEVIGDLQRRVRASGAHELSIEEVISDKKRDSREERSGSGEPTEQHSSREQGTKLGPAGDANVETARQVQAALSTRRSSFNADYFRNVARLGVQAAEALHHAHEHGIVHRDVKPGNLMLDGNGKLWVTDFGLARIEADAGMTMTGDLLGTLRYMAPEQALAKRVVVDHRADVYSLGATLYELLTLQPLFNGVNRQELIRQVAVEEPRPPRKASPAVPAELETIVRKAIEKNPEDRYESARQLADDLGRFLEDKPIHARPPTLTKRVAKWSRRHQSLVWSAAVTMLLFTACLAAGTLLIWREHQRTVSALAQADEHNERAEENFQMARAEAERANREAATAEQKAAEAGAVVNFLVRDLLGATTPEKALGRKITVEEVLANAEKKIDTAFADQPLVEAAIRHTLGFTHLGLGDYPLAKRQFERACELRSEHLGPENVDTLLSMNKLDDVSQTQRKLDEVEKTLQILQGVFEPEHPDLLRSMHCLAVTLHNQRKYVEAQKLHEETLQIQRRVLGPEHWETLLSMANLAAVLHHRGKLDEAQNLLELALPIQRRVRGPEQWDTLSSMGNLAYVFRSQGKLDEAQKLLEETLTIERRVLGSQHPQTLSSMEVLAGVLNKQGELDDCEKLHEETLQIRRRVLGTDHHRTIFSMGEVSGVLIQRGKLDEAQKLLEETLQISRRALGPEHPETLWSMGELAGVLRKQGKLDEAEKLLEEKRKLDDAKKLVAEKQEIPDAAEKPREMALKNAAWAVNKRAWDLATDPHDRDPGRAAELATRAVELAPMDGGYWNTLGVAHYHAGEWKAAIEALKKSMGLSSSPDESFNTFFLSMAHCQLGNKDDARKWYDRGVEWMEKNRPNDKELRRYRAEVTELLGIKKKQSKERDSDSEGNRENEDDREPEN